MRASDLPLLYEWLQREHVQRWWTDRETYEEVVHHYLPEIEGSEPTDLFLILLDDQAGGFIQTYRVSDHPEYRELVAVEDGVAGVDLLIGEHELIGRGLGSRALGQFLRDIVFADPEIHACIADPDTENHASLRAFEKAGFHVVRQFADPNDRNRLHTLLRIDR
ncbi:MAG: acetyltransferase [Actinomycetota bacterium]|nr:acetyltransferase [Actinomycetota bacterium]